MSSVVGGLKTGRASMSNNKMSLEDVQELKDQFTSVDKNGDGFIELSDLQTALELCGIKLPGWEVRKMIADRNTENGKLSYEEFEKLSHYGVRLGKASQDLYRRRNSVKRMYHQRDDSKVRSENQNDSDVEISDTLLSADNNTLMMVLDKEDCTCESAHDNIHLVGCVLTIKTLAPDKINNITVNISASQTSEGSEMESGKTIPTEYRMVNDSHAISLEELNFSVVLISSMFRISSIQVYSDLKANEVASTFKKVVSKNETVETIGGLSAASSEGTTHSVRLEEQLAFSDWINTNLGRDPDLKHLLPIDSEGKKLYDTVKDGILLCKIINHSCPDTIDERAINKKNLTTYTKLENLTLALVSSQAIGCNIINIDAPDLDKGKPHLVLGLLWQIIRIGLFNQITLENCPGLPKILTDVETIEDLMKLSPEAILLRWVNYHLESAGVRRRCNNFQNDITDSEIYSYLLKQIAPQDTEVTIEALMTSSNLNAMDVEQWVVNDEDSNLTLRYDKIIASVLEGGEKVYEEEEEDMTSSSTISHEEGFAGLEKALQYLEGRADATFVDLMVSRQWRDRTAEPDLMKRAEIMLQQAGKLGCRSFVKPADVINGVYKLNLAFVANLFNNHPGLGKPEGAIEGLENLEETREEKTYRNWMNSMGVMPYVNWLYSDLADGLIIFQLYDIIKPGIVNWNRVHRKFCTLRKFMEKLENCNYAVELGKQLGFSLVGIAGQDLSDGNSTLTLALIWQLMRAYTLSVLTQLANTGSPIVEREIVTWVNNKLQSANKRSSLKSFQDTSVSDAKVVIDLIDAIKPGTINYDLVKDGQTEEEKRANAKYAISMARKTGARVYALPEDITEVKPKMVMTMFACLMAMDYIPNMGSRN